MIERIGLKGRFHVDSYEEDILVDSRVFKNRILRTGLVAVVRYGYHLASFDTFAVGSSSAGDSGSYAGVLQPLGDDKVGARLTDETLPSWGFTATYDPGQATGTWAEIGMRRGNIFLNRARFVDDNGNPVTLEKTALRRTIVTVVFTLIRV